MSEELSKEELDAINKIQDRKYEDYMLLEEYSRWLEKNGYIDSDWYCEEPGSIDAFLEEKEKTLTKVKK